MTESDPRQDPASTYADPNAIGHLVEGLSHFSEPERVFKDVYDDSEYIWDAVSEHGDEVDLANPDVLESGQSIEISTGDLSEDWREATPGVIEVQALHLVGEDDVDPDTRLLQFELYDELDDDADPLYIGSLAVTKEEPDQALPVVRYHLPDDDTDYPDFHDWPQLIPADFQFNPENDETQLRVVSPEDNDDANQGSRNLHLRALLSALDSTERYLRDTDLEHEPNLSVDKKADAVIRLLGGEGLDELSAATGVEVYRLKAWREEFLDAGKFALRERSAKPKGRSR